MGAAHRAPLLAAGVVLAVHQQGLGVELGDVPQALALGADGACARRVGDALLARRSAHEVLVQDVGASSSATATATDSTVSRADLATGALAPSTGGRPARRAALRRARGRPAR